MHNDTPLGTTMHLKELDRQASLKLNPSRGRGQNSYPATAIRRALISLLRRLDGARLPLRAASRG